MAQEFKYQSEIQQGEIIQSWHVSQSVEAFTGEESYDITVSGSSTLTGTESGATQDTTYTFTITATDAEGQTADREFTLTFTFGTENSMQFN